MVTAALMCLTVRTIKAGICNVCQLVCLSASLSVVTFSQESTARLAGLSVRLNLGTAVV